MFKSYRKRTGNSQKQHPPPSRNEKVTGKFGYVVMFPVCTEPAPWSKMALTIAFHVRVIVDVDPVVTLVTSLEPTVSPFEFTAVTLK